ncbi:MAG: amine oxidase [Candidatus Binatia bacterium]|nr:MAG: amine oxidase [Candidatus Binatia bacterium]
MTVPHPLEPLSAEEISRAVEILKEAGKVGERTRFCSIVLDEPTKKELASHERGESIPRRARAVAYDPEAGGWIAVADLSSQALVSFRRVTEGQVHLSFLDFLEAIALVRENPEWRAALRKRGIENFELVQIDPWVTGGFPPEGAEPGTRILRALSYVRTFREDNGYARPVEGVIAYVDLTRKRVIRVEDHGVVPLPPEPGNYRPEDVGKLREDLAPLEITQPAGPSFRVEGREVRWQKWRFRVSLHPTQGLVLHTVTYDDGGRERKILHRAALAEMVVPYGDTSPMHYWKSVFDAGEMGIGHLTNSLRLGCDCLGVIHYFDATFANFDGTPFTIPNAICMHEEDFGILWKHVDLHSGTTEVRRSRRLVVSSIHTVGNYEYGFFWYFYLDGTLELQVKLTGIVQTSAVPEGVVPECAPLVAPRLAAPNHQHLFNFRLDFDVDGEENSVYEVDVERLPDERNPHGNAFSARETLLASEAQARRDVDPSRGRFWKIVNPNVRNRLGSPVAYRLFPLVAPRLFAREDSSVARRAAFARHNLWVTAYDPEELAAAGDSPNQHPGGAGLPAYQARNRPLENRDVVLWYTFGVTHIPRPEDWPVMPVEYTGFLLQPYGFFDRNPALDVPPQEKLGRCHR